ADGADRLCQLGCGILPLLLLDLHYSGDGGGGVLDEGLRDRPAVVPGEILDDASSRSLAVLAADLLGETWRGGQDDTGVAFQRTEGSASLARLVDVARHDHFAVGSLVGHGFLALAGPTSRAQPKRGTIGVELLEGFTRSQDT